VRISRLRLHGLLDPRSRLIQALACKRKFRHAQEGCRELAVKPNGLTEGLFCSSGITRRQGAEGLLISSPGGCCCSSGSCRRRLQNGCRLGCTACQRQAQHADCGGNLQWPGLPAQEAFGIGSVHRQIVSIGVLQTAGAHMKKAPRPCWRGGPCRDLLKRCFYQALRPRRLIPRPASARPTSASEPGSGTPSTGTPPTPLKPKM
jgi:hypothetical protein